MNEHIVINKDRSVVVPISEKKIGIQYDHNVNKITFDCPRYADDNEAIDMSRMHVFLNYMLPDKTTGCTILENVVVDETDPAIIHFDWVVTRNHTRVKGVMSTLICIKQTDTEGTELYHWNTDLFQQFIVGDGMECSKIVVDENPDVITQLLVRMDAVDARTSTEAIQGYVNNYLAEHPVSPTEEQMKQGVAANSEMFQSSVDDYLGRNPLQLDNGLTETTKAAPANKVGEIQSDVTDLKGDLDGNKKAVEELNDKKITKFYANNLGETTLNDSDKGKIQDMLIFGKSVQDGTPTPDNPIEIQSVMNPAVKVCGKNLFDIDNPIYCGKNEIDFENKPKIENGLIYSGGITGNYNGSALCIEVKKDEVYTFSMDNSGESFNGMIQHFENVGISNSTTVKYISGTGYNSFSVTSPNDGYLGICFHSNTKYGAIIKNLQIEKVSQATDYEPYTEQTATLPYTLNAIPVSDGGNYTDANGQQWIADYVDVERGKLVRHVCEVDLGALNWIKISGTNRWQTTKNDVYHVDNTTAFEALAEKYVADRASRVYAGTTNNTFSNEDGNKITVYNNSSTITPTGLVKYRIKTPTETDLTDDAVQAFKELATYYPTTNVSVTSDQVDGYTTFNYPVGLANGWNYVKEQLGDTRDYIYDMELQSAEAYVNSEYAVALAELEV